MPPIERGGGSTGRTLGAHRRLALPTVRDKRISDGRGTGRARGGEGRGGEVGGETDRGSRTVEDHAWLRIMRGGGSCAIEDHARWRIMRDRGSCAVEDQAR